jgi:hypothetical protein
MRKSLIEQYMEKTGRDPIPLFEVMGNSILQEKFYNCPDAVYAYCLEHNKTWEEVLDFKYEEGVMY